MRTSELFIHAFRIVLCLDTEAKPLIVTPKPRPIGQGGGGGGEEPIKRSREGPPLTVD